jgi:hypothetical protein
MIASDFDQYRRVTYDMLKLLGDVGGLYTGVFFIFFIIVERLQKFNADAFATTHLFVQSSEAFR